MKPLTVAVCASALLAGALTLSTAQAQQGSNAVTTQGSGAVGTMGPGENPNTSGIGGSASSRSATTKSSTKKRVMKQHPATTGSTRARSSGATMRPAGSNAVTNKGSGAVNPLGPGESSGSAGIGGSGTSAPPQ
jgi:hypothetical protein